MQIDHQDLNPQGIGGSDIAALLGLSPFKTPLELWAQKVGHPTRATAEGIHLRFGQFVEPFVAKEYERRTGLHTFEHATALHHPEHNFMYGHIDRFVMDSENTPAVLEGSVVASSLLECKTTSAFNKDEWGEEGSDQVPSAYLLQCAWYMAITGCAHADIAVLIGNQDFRIYRIKQDKKLESLMIDQAKRFWYENVLEGVAPQPKNTSDVRLLFPQEDVGKTLEATPDILTSIDRLKEVQSKSKALDEKAESIKSEIMNAMGAAERICHRGQVLATWKQTKPAQRIDPQAIKVRYPDIAKECMVSSPPARRFVVKELT